jgi:hypothetical protein
LTQQIFFIVSISVLISCIGFKSKDFGMKVESVNEITEYGGVWQSFEKIDVEIEK